VSAGSRELDTTHRITRITQLETVKTVVELDIRGRIVRLFVYAEGNPFFGLSSEFGKSFLVCLAELVDIGIVGIGNYRAAASDAGKKLAEGPDYIVNVFIVIEMIFLDIENRRYLGPQFKEAAVVFASLGHEKFALAYPAGTFELRNIGAYDVIGAYPQLFEDISRPAPAAALAVSTGNGDPAVAVHQGPEHIGIFHHPKTLFTGVFEFGIVLTYRCRYHDRFHIIAEPLDPLGHMTAADISTKLIETADYKAAALVGTADAGTVFKQNFRKPAHSDTPGAYEVILFIFKVKFHRVLSNNLQLM
jgi:hypothetical protein